MTNKTVKYLGLLIVCIMTGIVMTSCSSDDDPKDPVIPNLDQKLLTGIWIS